MITNIILVVLGVILVAFIVNTIEDHRRKDKDKISFKESIDLTDLPVITFICGEKKLNFLLDTGSNKSYINKNIAKDIPYTLLNGTEEVISASGEYIPSELGVIEITYKDQLFKTEVNIMDLSGSFDSIKKESGVQIHGILGNIFFQKYKYVLDFESLVAYMK